MMLAYLGGPDPLATADLFIVFLVLPLPERRTVEWAALRISV